MKNDILPGLARDPDYAAKRGYEVIRRGNAVTVRQPPGERNALGHVKFMFPNRHAVYLHDTPGRHLFARQERALSHGCVRVEHPLRLASAILTEGVGPEWTESRLRGMVGYGERMIRLTQKVPVHLTYFTQQVDASGQLVSFDDIYGFNRLVRQALGYRG
jgi:murein L,D-transpeptidase YcbB/YkuD